MRRLLLDCLVACRLLLAAVVGVAPSARLGDVANVMALLLIAGGQQVLTIQARISLFPELISVVRR
jgi:hypothetical protein